MGKTASDVQCGLAMLNVLFVFVSVCLRVKLDLTQCVFTHLFVPHLLRVRLDANAVHLKYMHVIFLTDPQPVSPSCYWGQTQKLLLCLKVLFVEGKRKLAGLEKNNVYFGVCNQRQIQENFQGSPFNGLEVQFHGARTPTHRWVPLYPNMVNSKLGFIQTVLQIILISLVC